MAENKKAILFYVDWIELISELKDADAGKLIKHILKYVNDENPPEPNGVIKMVWIPIKQQLKRDLKKWEGTLEKRSEAGRLGGIRSGEARRSKTKQNEANVQNAKQNEANEAVTDTVTVTVTDNVNVDVKSNNPLSIRSVDEIGKEAKTAEIWKNNLMLIHKINSSQVDGFIDQFTLHLKSQGTINKSEQDYKKHFANWLNKKDLRPAQVSPIKTSLNFGSK